MFDVTPQFVFQVERRMRNITETEYVRRLLDENTWWNKIARTTPIEGKTERFNWFLSTAFIEPVGPSGTGAMPFEDMVAMSAEYPVFRHGKGLKVSKDQFEDLQGTGLDMVAQWSSDIGSDTAYYPQRLFAQLVLNGAATDGSANAYDTVPFFDDGATGRTINGTASVHGHPLNPFNPQVGSYVNWLHGAAGNTPTGPGGANVAYPGALPIDDSVTVDVALQNLGKAIAYIAGVKMPNGIDPRFLKPEMILAPPRMAPRLRQLLDAKYIAQAAASGGGSGDVEALIRGWALGEPVIAQELAATSSYQLQYPFVASGGNVSFLTKNGVVGNDTSYYIVCREARTTQLGGLLYVTRRPFKVKYYNGEGGGTGVDAIIDRANELEWHVDGRVSAQYGHPYSIWRVDGS